MISLALLALVALTYASSSSSSSSSSVSSLESDSVESSRVKDAYNIVKPYYDAFSVKATETPADVAWRKQLLQRSVTKDFLDCTTNDIPRDCDTLASDFAFIDDPKRQAFGQNYQIKSLTVADDVVTVIGEIDYFEGKDDWEDGCDYKGRLVIQELAIFKVEGNKIKQVLYSGATIIKSLSVAGINCPPKP